MRELQFDPAAVGGPVDRMDLEVSAFLAPGSRVDALDAALAADPRVLGVDIRRDEAVAGSGRYILLRLSYDIAKHDTAPEAG